MELGSLSPRSCRRTLVLVGLFPRPGERWERVYLQDHPHKPGGRVFHIGLFQFFLCLPTLHVPPTRTPWDTAGRWEGVAPHLYHIASHGSPKWGCWGRPPRLAAHGSPYGRALSGRRWAPELGPGVGDREERAGEGRERERRHARRPSDDGIGSGDCKPPPSRQHTLQGPQGKIRRRKRKRLPRPH